MILFVGIMFCGIGLGNAYDEPRSKIICENVNEIEFGGNSSVTVKTDLIPFVNSLFAQEFVLDATFDYKIKISSSDFNLEFVLINSYDCSFSREGLSIDKWTYGLADGDGQVVCDDACVEKIRHPEFDVEIVSRGSTNITFPLLNLTVDQNISVVVTLENLRDFVALPVANTDSLKTVKISAGNGFCEIEVASLPTIPTPREETLNRSQDNHVSEKIRRSMMFLGFSFSSAHRDNPWMFPLIGGAIVAVLVGSLCFVKGRRRYYDDDYNDEPECDQKRSKSGPV